MSTQRTQNSQFDPLSIEGAKETYRVTYWNQYCLPVLQHQSSEHGYNSCMNYASDSTGNGSNAQNGNASYEYYRNTFLKPPMKRVSQPSFTTSAETLAYSVRADILFIAELRLEIAIMQDSFSRSQQFFRARNARLRREIREDLLQTTNLLLEAAEIQTIIDEVKEVSSNNKAIPTA